MCADASHRIGANVAAAGAFAEAFQLDAVRKQLLQATVTVHSERRDCADGNNKRHEHPTDSVDLCRALRVVRLVKIGHWDFSTAATPKAA
jgi:hypothetical protein